MKIEYCGPKPIITHHGISFKEGKEDKYTYLKLSLQILKAINHEYNSNKTYSYFIDTRDLSDNEMIDMIMKFHPDIETVLEQEVQSYKKYIQNEEDNVKNHSILNQEEKNIFLSNLKIMELYKIQRMKNKLFYNHIIETIKEEIFEHKIKELTAPFTEKSWHVFQTIQGELSSSKTSITTDLKVNDGETLTVKLIINNI